VPVDFPRRLIMLRPETPQEAGGEAAEVAKDVVVDSSNNAQSGDAARAGVAPDSPGDDSTGTPWADDRTTDLDPSRVGSDDSQAPAKRTEGEPDE
jgi:hypothetical protein